MTKLKALKLTAFLGVLFCSCASNSYFVRDKSYDSIQDKKKIYVCPISSIRFNDSARMYTQFYLRKTPTEIEDTLLNSFNEEYRHLAQKCIKKDRAILCATENELNIESDDSSRILLYKVFDKKKTKFIEIGIPTKQSLQEKGISCNYALFINDIVIYQTSYYVPIILPIPGGIIGGNASGPAFGIKGKFICWDYDKGSVICAGDFDKNMMTCNIGGSKRWVKDKAFPILAKIMGRTHFWYFSDRFDRANNEAYLNAPRRNYQ